MRSPLLSWSLVVLALGGCGKSVERNAQALSQGQQNGSPIQGNPPALPRPAGDCRDPISANYKRIERFSDVAFAAGKYAMTKFDAVGAAPAAIAVVSGVAKADGTFATTECHDLSAMPEGGYRWGASAPKAIDAKDGTIAENLDLTQAVYGPGVTDRSGPRAAATKLVSKAADRCVSAAEAMSGDGCPAAVFYQIDANTIGVLRVTQATVGGMAVQSKIFAQYALIAGEAPDSTPRSSRRHPPSARKRPPYRHPAPPKNGGQGTDPKNGGQGVDVAARTSSG